MKCVVSYEELESAESRVDKLERREQLRCSYCPPNRGENAKRKPKYGQKKKGKHRK